MRNTSRQHKLLDVSAIVENDPVACQNLVALNRSAEGQCAGWQYRNVRDAIVRGALRRHRQANAEQYARGHSRFNPVLAASERR